VVHTILNVLEKNTLEPIPMIVTVLSILSAINSICFCFADILIEILMATGAAYHLSFRLSYLILVILSALIGVFTLSKFFCLSFSYTSFCSSVPVPVVPSTPSHVPFLLVFLFLF
jgi:hypothetical protein